jgi:hypothetical protein
MLLPVLGLSGAVAASALLVPYRLPLAAVALGLQAAAHILAARRRRRPALLWVGTAVTLGFVATTLVVGARMGMPR